MNLTDKEIIEALEAAKKAAESKADTPDGGSANLDCVTMGHGRKNRRIAALAEGLGIMCSMSQEFGRRVIHLHFGRGQGNRNMAMCEAASEALNKAGLEASMFYMMD